MSELVGSPEDRFSRLAAQTIVFIHRSFKLIHVLNVSLKLRKHF